MTSDKLNRKNSSMFEMALGEQPSHGKFNFGSNIENQNLNYLEEAIGDVRSITSSNNRLSSHPLRSLNIARLIGPNGKFQPYANPDSQFYFEANLEPNRNEWVLPHWPIGTDGTTYVSVSGNGATALNGSTVFETDVSPNKPSNPGEWAYDSNKCSIISFLAPVNETASVQCRTHLKANTFKGRIPFFSAGHGADSLNIIPGLDVDVATNIIVETSTSTAFSYIIKIGLYNNSYKTPPLSEDFSGLSSGGFDDLNALERSVRGVERFPAIAGGYYPIPKLPHQIIESFASEELIPTPYVALWDDASTSFVSRGKFYFRDATSLFYSNGIALSTGTTSYRVVCLGNSISDKLESISFDMDNHSHEGPRALDHFGLMNLGWPGHTNNAPASMTSDDKSWCRPLVSQYREDPHPQYLLRHGFLGTDYPNLGNALLGNLRFARSNLSFLTSSPSDLLESDGDSFGLEFASTNFGLKTVAFNMTYLSFFGDSIIQNDRSSTTFGSLGNTKIFGLNINGGQTYFNTDYSTAVDFSSIGLNDIYVKKNTNTKITFVGSGSLAATNVENAEVEVLGNNNIIAVQDFKNGKATLIGENIVAIVSGTNMNYENNSGTVMKDYGNRYLYYPITPDKIVKVDKVDGKKYLSEKTALDGDGVKAPEFLISSVAAQNGVGSFGTIDDADFAFFFSMPGDSVLKEVNVFADHNGADFEIYFYHMNGSLALATSTSFATQSGLHSWDLGTGFGVMGSRYPNLNSTSIDLMLLIKNTGSALSDDHIKIFGGQYKLSILRF